MWQSLLQHHALEVPALITPLHVMFTHQKDCAARGGRKDKKSQRHAFTASGWALHELPPRAGQLQAPQRLCHSSTGFLHRTFTPACCLLSILGGRKLAFITSFSFSCYCLLKQKPITSTKHKMLHSALSGGLTLNFFQL